MIGVARASRILVCLLFWGQIPIWGQTPAEVCPATFPAQPPEGAQAGRQELKRLEDYSEACSARADYFAWQGALLLTEKKPQQAAIALEKALLLNPDLPGAELDYAQALAELGEQASARQLVQSVLGRSDIPAALHDWLTSLEGDWIEPLWQWRWLVQSLLGAESNLNSAPSSSSLTLTLPGGAVPVILAQSERPHAGMASLNTAALEATRPLGQGRITFSGEGTVRVTPGDTSNGLQWIDAAVTGTQPLWGFDVGTRLGLMRLWLGGVELYDENAIKLFAERPLPWGGGACRYGVGMDYSARGYPASPTLDGHYVGGQLGLGCQQGNATLSAVGQWGNDRAQDSLRLGGTQHRDDFFLTAGKTLGPGMATFSAQWSRLQDADIYSPLLGGIPREILRQAARAQYEYFVNNQLSVIGYLGRTSQNSNIGLFALNNQAIYLGLRWSGK